MTTGEGGGGGGGGGGGARKTTTEEEDGDDESDEDDDEDKNEDADDEENNEEEEEDEHNENEDEDRGAEGVEMMALNLINRTNNKLSGNLVTVVVRLNTRSAPQAKQVFVICSVEAKRTVETSAGAFAGGNAISRKMNFPSM